MDHFLNVPPGVEILEAVRKFCEAKRMRSAYFSGIGALSSATVGFYHLRKQTYSFRRFSQDLEIVSLTGNVGLLGSKLVAHAHISAADKHYRMIGGHLKEAIVSGACEVFLRPFPITLVRQFDKATGLNLISASAEKNNAPFLKQVTAKKTKERMEKKVKGKRGSS